MSSASAGFGGGGGGVVSTGAAVATVSTGGGGGGGGGCGAGSSPAQADRASDVVARRTARRFERIGVSFSRTSRTGRFPASPLYLLWARARRASVLSIEPTHVRARPLGKTGLRVTEMALGTWGLSGDGYGPVEEREQEHVLARALEMGFSLIDTADAYGGGRMERLVGPRGGRPDRRRRRHEGRHRPHDHAAPQALRRSLPPRVARALAAPPRARPRRRVSPPQPERRRAPGRRRGRHGDRAEGRGQDRPLGRQRRRPRGRRARRSAARRRSSSSPTA